MTDLIAAIEWIEFLFIRLIVIAAAAGSFVIAFYGGMEAIRNRRVNWSWMGYMLLVITLMQVFLRFLPAMNMRSMTIGLQNARAETGDLEAELENWSLFQGFDLEATRTVPLSIPTAIVAPAATPMPIIPPTSPVTREPTATLVQQVSPADSPPTPSDITRRPP